MSTKSPAQINGSWLGTLTFNNISMPVVFNLVLDGERLSATVDTPSQEAYGIKCDTANLAADKITLGISSLQLTYVGALSSDGETVAGLFTQAGIEIPLSLKRERFVAPKRPQEPKAPYPYLVEEVSFAGKAGVISGTITRPRDADKHTAVVLVHGSGPHSRDQPIFFHKPFWVIADYLARQGFVVLRYDKRGIGRSAGNYSQATTMDFADDAESALRFLKGCQYADSAKLGIIGHSEGGLVAPIVAARNPDCAFIVMMAGSALPGDQILLKQIEVLERAAGATEAEIRAKLEESKEVFAVIKAETDEKVVAQKISEIANRANLAEASAKDGSGRGVTISTNAETDNTPSPMIGAWYRTFITYDPVTALNRVICPVLAINGEKDYQVTPDDNLSVIENALKTAGNKHVTVRKFAGLNHLFQTCETGLPSEYGQIEETISPTVLKTISAWMCALSPEQ